MTKVKNVLLLFSDTGGGHRSAAEAIIEALRDNVGRQCELEMVDVLKEYAPLPFDYIPRAYPKMVRVPRAWGLGYRISDGHRRTRVLSTALWPYVGRGARRLVREKPADLIVSVHPVLIAPVLRALGPERPPFLTVVTDLVTTHAFWYHAQSDLTFVPTEEARQKALECGLKAGRVRVTGLPVARRFCQPPGDPLELRRMLGWPADRPMVLLVGGGEGMGPIYETARAIANLAGGFGLAVIAGRNEALEARLRRTDWPGPTFVYGFERRMPEMMQAATLLVTKAGPGTLAEALNAGLPMVLYSRLPGQEDGNVDYIVDQGVGIWAPGPQAAADAVSSWLERPDELKRAASICQSIARPNAAIEVAQVIAERLGLRSASDVELKRTSVQA